jgi:hypothetical protein
MEQMLPMMMQQSSTPVCEQAPTMAFINEVICAPTCKADGGMDALTKSSGSDNADPVAEGSALLCEDPCFSVLIPGFITLMKDLMKCPSYIQDMENADERAGEEFTQMTTMIEKLFGFMCIRQSGGGPYCMDMLTALVDHEANMTETNDRIARMYEKPCMDPEVIRHMELGCCLGSTLAFARDLADMDSSGSEEGFLELDLAVAKTMECGESVYPCTEGSFLTEVTIESEGTLQLSPSPTPNPGPTSN